MKNFILAKVKQAVRLNKKSIILMDDGRNISPAEARKNFRAIARAAQKRESSPWRVAGVFLK